MAHSWGFCHIRDAPMEPMGGCFRVRLAGPWPWPRGPPRQATPVAEPGEKAGLNRPDRIPLFTTSNSMFASSIPDDVEECSSQKED